MKLNALKKTTKRKTKRVGRGYGSGKGGHSASRGSKGQRARSKVKIWFEGGQLPLIKRLPFQRGKGRFKSIRNKPVIVNLKYLNLLPKGARVTVDSLVKHGIVQEKTAKEDGVKVLGDGKLEKPLKVELATSKAAAKAIEKAGGSVVKSEKKKAPVSKAKQKKSSQKVQKKRKAQKISKRGRPKKTVKK